MKVPLGFGPARHLRTPRVRGMGRRAGCWRGRDRLLVTIRAIGPLKRSCHVPPSNQATERRKSLDAGYSGALLTRITDTDATTKNRLFLRRRAREPGRGNRSLPKDAVPPDQTWPQPERGLALPSRPKCSEGYVETNVTAAVWLVKAVIYQGFVEALCLRRGPLISRDGVHDGVRIRRGCVAAGQELLGVWHGRRGEWVPRLRQWGAVACGEQAALVEL